MTTPSDQIDELGALEDEQRAAVAHVPLPRRAIPRRIVALLWLLRLYVLVSVPLAVYAFIEAMRK